MRWSLGLLSLGLIACAASTTPSSGAEDLYWLFRSDALEELPEPEDGVAVDGPRYHIVVPSAFEVVQVEVTPTRVEARLSHVATKTEARVLVDDGVLPSDSTAIIKSVLAFMNEGFDEISERRRLKVELLPPLGAASTAQMDELFVDGLVWWRPGGRCIRVKVINKQVSSDAVDVLRSDLRLLLSATDEANGGGS